MRLMLTAFALFATVPALAQNSPVAVSTRPFGEIVIYPEREAYASVVTLNDSKVSTEVTARIVDIPVQVGQVVERGEVLARLDPKDYQLAVARAAAALEASRARADLAQAQLKRARALVQQGFISQEALNQRESDAKAINAEMAANRAELATARRNLEKCVVRAPFKAVVRQRLGQVGESAVPGTPLVQILDMEHNEVSAAVQPADARDLERMGEIAFVGQTARYPVQLLRIVPALDPRERSQEARFGFTGEGALPGAAGRVVWKTSRPHVPADLVVRRNGALGIFVAEGGKARFVPLPGAEEGRPAPADLPAATPLVTEGRLQLRPGDAISVAK
jgi:RND family efflux transporter MFP subunit